MTKQGRTLVTGGAGFIGSNLCRRLLERGEEVVCLDNLLTSHRSNIEPLLADANFTFVRQDIIDPILIDGISRIYNLACPASPLHYQNNPVRTIKASVIGVINVLGLARRLKARVLQASTSEVYGDPLEHPQRESYRGNVNPIGPRACYDEGKRCAETLFFDYHREHGVDIQVVRIFNTYGPRMHPADGRVVSNFILQALQGKPMTVQGDGSQTRSFCYVSDLVDGLLKMMDLDEPFQGPVNLGNPHEFTILELAEKVIRLTGSRSSIVHQPLPQDDPIKRRPDISLAQRKLGWTPGISLDQGLPRTIEYFSSLDLASMGVLNTHGQGRGGKSGL